MSLLNSIGVAGLVWCVVTFKLVSVLQTGAEKLGTGNTRQLERLVSAAILAIFPALFAFLACL